MTDTAEHYQRMIPHLSSASFRFMQDADGNDTATQVLEVDVESCGGGPYLVIRTRRWAIDHPHELIDLLVRLQQNSEPLFDEFQGESPDERTQNDS